MWENLHPGKLLLLRFENRCYIIYCQVDYDGHQGWQLTCDVKLKLELTQFSVEPEITSRVSAGVMKVDIEDPVDRHHDSLTVGSLTHPEDQEAGAGCLGRLNRSVPMYVARGRQGVTSQRAMT